MKRLYLYGAGALVLSGLALGWYWFRPEPPKPETYATAQVQEDGSKALERKPQANAKPAHKIPKDAKVERIVRVTVEPDDAPLADGSVGVDCPALDVDLTLVRLPDESRRVVASSPNGEIVGGVDIPVSSAKSYKELKWAAGAVYSPLENKWGAWVDRDFGPIRAGVEYIERPMVKLGVRW